MRFKVDDGISYELLERMVEVSRRLRQEATPTEETLWQELRNRQLGAKFRRQQPIGPFVADFYCHEKRLIIEVDGPIHQFQRAADAERDELLQAASFHVLRISTEDVEQSLPGVLLTIERELSRLPSPSGEGIEG
jgi:very-short-patch-repair endonuclease